MTLQRSAMGSAVLLGLLNFAILSRADDATSPKAVTKPGPVVTVEAVYPAARAQSVADLIAAPIEQQVNGVEKMASLESRSGNDGSYLLSVSFRTGVDPNMALKLVQNRVSLALPILPVAVQNAGLTLRKTSPGVLMLAALTSPDGRYDSMYLSNYSTIQLKDELLRVVGVNDVKLLGACEYNLWLNTQFEATRGSQRGCRRSRPGAPRA